MGLTVLVRGGGDLASGVAVRLVRAGWRVIITELAKPLVVRRKVAFAEAVFNGQTVIEGISARLVERIDEVAQVFSTGQIAVLVDPDAKSIKKIQPDVLVDGRMTKRPPEVGMNAASCVIGLGPGFSAGLDCHAVVETRRGHHLGRVVWDGTTDPDTGIPETVFGRGEERVLRAPDAGILTNFAEIGEIVEEGQPVARVGDITIVAPFKGTLRGILYPGLAVTLGMKVGDLDPRCDASLCYQVSDKSLAVGGGVLEVILSRPDLRKKMWDCA